MWWVSHLAAAAEWLGVKGHAHRSLRGGNEDGGRFHLKVKVKWLQVQILSSTKSQFNVQVCWVSGLRLLVVFRVTNVRQCTGLRPTLAVHERVYCDPNTDCSDPRVSTTHKHSDSLKKKKMENWGKEKGALTLPLCFLGELPPVQYLLISQNRRGTGGCLRHIYFCPHLPTSLCFFSKRRGRGR